MKVRNGVMIDDLKSTEDNGGRMWNVDRNSECTLEKIAMPGYSDFLLMGQNLFPSNVKNRDN